MPPRNHLPLIQGTVHVVKLVRCGESGEIWADEDVNPNSDPRKKAFTAVCLDYEGDVIDDVLNEDSAKKTNPCNHSVVPEDKCGISGYQFQSQAKDIT